MAHPGPKLEHILAASLKYLMVMALVRLRNGCAEAGHDHNTWKEITSSLDWKLVMMVRRT